MTWTLFCSIFTFDVEPVASGRHSVVMACLSSENAAPRSPTILVVEDEGLIRCGTTEAFEDAGWTVLAAASGETALRLIERHRPSVIFTDINLAGGLTGWDVGSVGCAYGAKILYTSGERRAQALMLPDGVFFLKPYELGAVIGACSQAIAHAHPSQ